MPDRLDNLEKTLWGVQDSVEQIKDAIMGTLEDGKPGIMEQQRETRRDIAAVEERFKHDLHMMNTSMNSMRQDISALQQTYRNLETESWRTKVRLTAVAAIAGGGVGSGLTKMVDWMMK